MIPQNADFLQNNFDTKSLLGREDKGQSSHHLLCLHHNGFGTRDCGGHYWPTGWSASLLRKNASAKGRHLKEAHWKLRGLWHTKLFWASETEAHKCSETIKTSQRTSTFRSKGMFVAYLSLCSVMIWKPNNNSSYYTQVIINCNMKWNNQRSKLRQNSLSSAVLHIRLRGAAPAPGRAERGGASHGCGQIHHIKKTIQ